MGIGKIQILLLALTAVARANPCNCFAYDVDTCEEMVSSMYPCDHVLFGMENVVKPKRVSFIPTPPYDKNFERTVELMYARSCIFESSSDIIVNSYNGTHFIIDPTSRRPRTLNRFSVCIREYRSPPDICAHRIHEAIGNTLLHCMYQDYVNTHRVNATGGHEQTTNFTRPRL